MPTHIIKDPPPKSKKTKPKNWHPRVQEVQHCSCVRKLKLIAAKLAVSAVVTLDKDKDNLEEDSRIHAITLDLNYLFKSFMSSRLVVWSGLVWSGLVWSGLVWSGLVWSSLV
jgi:hypothetical protein